MGYPEDRDSTEMWCGPGIMLELGILVSVFKHFVHQPKKSGSRRFCDFLKREKKCKVMPDSPSLKMQPSLTPG